MKLWQADTLACKESKIADSSPFLTLASPCIVYLTSLAAVSLLSKGDNRPADSIVLGLN